MLRWIFKRAEIWIIQLTQCLVILQRQCDLLSLKIITFRILSLANLRIASFSWCWINFWFGLVLNNLIRFWLVLFGFILLFILNIELRCRIINIFLIWSIFWWCCKALSIWWCSFSFFDLCRLLWWWNLRICAIFSRLLLYGRILFLIVFNYSLESFWRCWLISIFIWLCICQKSWIFNAFWWWWRTTFIRRRSSRMFLAILLMSTISLTRNLWQRSFLRRLIASYLVFLWRCLRKSKRCLPFGLIGHGFLSKWKFHLARAPTQWTRFLSRHFSKFEIWWFKRSIFVI